MNIGPYPFLANLTYDVKRQHLYRQFPEWFSDDLKHFNVIGFIEWANQQSIAERNNWLRTLDVHEVAKVIETYRLWNNMARFAQTHSTATIHHWLSTTLPFWFNDGQFDHLGFAAWYHYANFMDKEITFKYLTPTEQKAVLKVWAAEPLKGLTPLFALEENQRQAARMIPTIEPELTPSIQNVSPNFNA